MPCSKGGTSASAHVSRRDVATADAELTCVLPRPGGATCGTRDGHLLRLHEGRWAPIQAFDAVDGRETWHAVGSTVPYVRSLTTTADDGALLANVHVGGIPRSGNGGASWKLTIDPDADVHQVRAHPSDPRLVLAPAAVGLAVSRDAGVSWQVVTDGLHATYLRAVAFTSGQALISMLWMTGRFRRQSAGSPPGCRLGQLAFAYVVWDFTSMSG
jgi:hypothetical protein